MDIRTITSATIIGLGLSISSCGTTQRTEGTMGTPAERDRTTTITPDVEIDEKNRRETLSKLEDLRDDIDDRIKKVDSRMRDTEDQARLDQLRDHRLELERNRARLTDEMRNIEVAEASNWHAVRQSARNTTQDVGDWFSRQGDRLDEIFRDDDLDDSDDDDDDDEQN